MTLQSLGANALIALMRLDRVLHAPHHPSPGGHVMASHNPRNRVLRPDSEDRDRFGPSGLAPG